MVKIYQVDAFTDKPFSGNPAAVCLLPQARDAAWMQAVGKEMNLSETAFLLKQEDGYNLRWFTPAVEVDLCGHATLASAHILWETGILRREEQARFHTRSGLLTAVSKDGEIELNFPAKTEEPAPAPVGLLEALRVKRSSGSLEGESRIHREEQVRLSRPGEFGRNRPRREARLCRPEKHSRPRSHCHQPGRFPFL